MTGAATPEYFNGQVKRIGLWMEDDLISLEIESELIGAVTAECAAQYHIIPFGMNAGKLLLATDSEQAFKEIDKVQQAAGRQVKLYFAEEDNVKMALSHYYKINTASFSRKSASSVVTDVDTTPLRRKIGGMIQEAIKQGASDIHLLPHEYGMYVSFRVNGHLIDFTDTYAIGEKEIESVVNIIKGMDMSEQADISRKNMPDKGAFSVLRGDEEINIRLSTVPLANGYQKVNLRLHEKEKNKEIKITELTYAPEDLAAIRAVIMRSASGMFLNSGPTGAGKTTSLYAQIRDRVDYIGEPLNVIAIENPVELREPRFCQVQVRESESEKRSLTAPKIFKVALRQDPDIILYGEIRDKEDAEVAIEAATTGHQVFSTVHAKDCVATIARLLDLGVSRGSLLSELNMILSQRLVGMLCPHCSVRHELSPEELYILSPEEIERLTAPMALLKARGSVTDIMKCPHCTYGYVRRVAVAEYIIFDLELRDMLLTEVKFSAIKEILEKKGFRSMWQKGLDMVAAGETDLRELLRTVGKLSD